MEFIKAMKFIVELFESIYPHGRGIETSEFFRQARAAGVYNGGYGEPISKALGILTECETITTPEEEYAYTVFRLRQGSIKETI